MIFISVSIDSAFFQWKELETAAANGSGFTGVTCRRASATRHLAITLSLIWCVKHDIALDGHVVV